ncbi:MAG TPA: hypothetical protein VGY66_26815, partial [Gemmataceae bacterium]|nr:hypothetical protein [Gemmataceae bacterium]
HDRHESQGTEAPEDGAVCASGKGKGKPANDVRSDAPLSLSRSGAVILIFVSPVSIPETGFFFSTLDANGYTAEWSTP